MPGLSIHVVDVSRGVVAVGMRIIVRAMSGEMARTLADGRASNVGTLDAAEIGGTLAAGDYEVDFHIAEFFRAAGVALPNRPFLNVVTYRFGIDDPHQHYHLPFKFTPWGYSCFRGGA